MKRKEKRVVKRALKKALETANQDCRIMFKFWGGFRAGTKLVGIANCLQIQFDFLTEEQFYERLNNERTAWLNLQQIVMAEITSVIPGFTSANLKNRYVHWRKKAPKGCVVFTLFKLSKEYTYHRLENDTWEKVS